MLFICKNAASKHLIEEGRETERKLRHTKNESKINQAFRKSLTCEVNTVFAKNENVSKIYIQFCHVHIWIHIILSIFFLQEFNVFYAYIKEFWISRITNKKKHALNIQVIIFVLVSQSFSKTNNKSSLYRLVNTWIYCCTTITHWPTDFLQFKIRSIEQQFMSIYIVNSDWKLLLYHVLYIEVALCTAPFNLFFRLNGKLSYISSSDKLFKCNNTYSIWLNLNAGFILQLSTSTKLALFMSSVMSNHIHSRKK